MSRRPLIPIRPRRGAIPFDPYAPPPGVWACRAARLVRGLHTYLTGLAWHHRIDGDIEMGIQFDADREAFTLAGTVALLIGRDTLFFGFRSVAKPGPAVVTFSAFSLAGPSGSDADAIHIAHEIADMLRIEPSILVKGRR